MPDSTRSHPTFAAATGRQGFGAHAFDTVVANVSAAVLEGRRSELGHVLAARAALVLSGLLTGDVSAIEAEYQDLGRVEVLEEGEWAAVVVRKRVVRVPRFHVPEAGPGARLELPEHAAHHAREVLRLRSGVRDPRLRRPRATSTKARSIRSRVRRFPRAWAARCPLGSSRRCASCLGFPP